MSYADHKSHKISARCVIITTSGTRTLADDESGAYLEKALIAAGHKVVMHTIVKNDPVQIKEAVLKGTAYSRKIRRQKSRYRPQIPIPECKKADVVIITGGTGISNRDITIETIRQMLTKELPGFGELFRFLSYQEIGSGAIMSRALAGVIGKKIIFCIPGSLNAVKLAAEKLIIPELSHMIWEVRR